MMLRTLAPLAGGPSRAWVTCAHANVRLTAVARLASALVDRQPPRRSSVWHDLASMALNRGFGDAE